MLQCEVCALSVNSQEQLTQHLGGKAHKKKLKAAGLNDDGTPLPVENNAGTGQEQSGNNIAGKKRKSGGESEAGMCSMCNIVFNSAVQAQQHYSGNKHFKRMKIIQGEGEATLAAPVAPVAQETSIPGQAVKAQVGMQYCGFCKVHVNSMEQLEKHRQGAKHKKNLEKVKSVPVTYPGHTYKDVTGMTPVTAADTTKTVPSFESYLSSSFVKAESTESNMPSLDSYLKG